MSFIHRASPCADGCRHVVACERVNYVSAKNIEILMHNFKKICENLRYLWEITDVDLLGLFIINNSVFETAFNFQEK